MADDNEDTRPDDLTARVGHLETEQAEQGSKLDTILEKLGHLVPGSHAEAQERTETRLDRASSVQEQVRAELARAQQEDDAKRKADADKAERESLKATVASLSEAKPQPPTPRRTKLLGWSE